MRIFGHFSAVTRYTNTESAKPTRFLLSYNNNARQEEKTVFK